MHRKCLVEFIISVLTFYNVSVRVSKPDTLAEEWDRISWKEFWKLAHETPQAGIHIQSTEPLLSQIDIQTEVVFNQKT
jgi:hypothetical protein